MSRLRAHYGQWIDPREEVTSSVVPAAAHVVRLPPHQQPARAGDGARIRASAATARRPASALVLWTSVQYGEGDWFRRAALRERAPPWLLPRSLCALGLGAYGFVDAD